MTTDGRRLQLLTPPEVARRLHVSIKTLERWRAIGSGPPFHRIGLRAVRYAPRDLDAWIDAQRGTDGDSDDKTAA